VGLGCADRLPRGCVSAAAATNVATETHVNNKERNMDSSSNSQALTWAVFDGLYQLLRIFYEELNSHILTEKHMYKIDEIADSVYRITVYAEAYDLEFSHFLVKDDEPLLFHTGLRGMFPLVSEAVSRLIDPSTLRHISFSHFESDECGTLNHWLELAPQAEPVCGLVGALVSVNDFSIRPARALTRDDTFTTGRP
jgi:hypothetical protein